MRYLPLLFTWLTMSATLACSDGQSSTADSPQAMNEPQVTEPEVVKPDEMGGGEPAVSLGGGDGTHATETNVVGVYCETHETCGAGSACVYAETPDGLQTRCSFVMLKDATACKTDDDCEGALKCLTILPGLDAGVTQICDAIPMDNSSGSGISL